MRKALLATLMAVALIGLLAWPAAANHVKSPISIQATSSHAATCEGVPGDGAVTASGFTNALSNNRIAGNQFSIPNDLGNGSAAGACNFNTSDAIWSAATPRHIPGVCTDTIFSGCKGLHFPGLGPPARPGRFLQNADGFSGGTQAASFCQYVSTSGASGPCHLAALGYVLQGNAVAAPGLGGYCGGSRGFYWAMTSTNPQMTLGQAFAFGEWEPHSAGTILPLRLTTTGPNWSSNHNFQSIDTANRVWNDSGNLNSSADGNHITTYGLASARSYVAQVDSNQPNAGSCVGAANAGAQQFLSQTITVTLGPTS